MSRYLVWGLLSLSVIGTILVFFFSKFFVIWLCLELSTFSIMPILFLSKSTRAVEASFKYFLMKVMAALMFLTWGVHMKFSSYFWGFKMSESLSGYGLVMFPLSMKLGLAPFHYWFPEVLQGVGFLQGFWVSTWQKISPLYLCYSYYVLELSALFFILGTISVLVGGWGGLNQTQIRKLLGFSSISYMGWVFCALPSSEMAVVFLFLSYFMVSGGLFIFFNSCRFFSLFNLSKFVNFPLFLGVVVCGLFSLSGIPPFGGFLIKVIPLGSLMVGGKTFFVFPLVLGALLSLFFYLRVLFNLSFLMPPVSVGSSLLFVGSKNSFISSFSLGWFFSFSLLLMLYLDLFLLSCF